MLSLDQKILNHTLIALLNENINLQKSKELVK
jgi:hypothetical protein